MPLKPQIPVTTEESDEALRFIRQMGIEYVSLMLKPEEITDKTVAAQQERLAEYSLQVSDALCPALQKNKSIHLGYSDRDEQIERFLHLLRVLGKAHVPFTSIAWQPNGILRTGYRAGENTRGGISSYVCQEEILKRHNAEERSYDKTEIWNNFQYFLDRVIPVAEEVGVRLALHPNDPPLSCMAGIPSLIYNTDCYRKAFAMAHESPALGMKLCVGCWLEGGEAFGNIMADIQEFCKKDKILCIHFRNVDSPLPNFQETLAEDGYADMYAIMKQFVACDCNAVISIDHAFKPLEGFGGVLGAFAYSTGYMKGLMEAAERELGR